MMVIIQTPYILFHEKRKQYEMIDVLKRLNLQKHMEQVYGIL